MDVKLGNKTRIILWCFLALIMPFIILVILVFPYKTLLDPNYYSTAEDLNRFFLLKLFLSDAVGYCFLFFLKLKRDLMVLIWIAYIPLMLLLLYWFSLRVIFAFCGSAL
jgi:hypothetical protein